MNRIAPMKPNALALAVLTAALVLSGCKDSAKPGAQTAPSAPALTEAATGEPAAAPVDPLTVSVPPGFGAEIRVAPVGATPLSDTLRVAGKVDFDETRVTRIGATVTGRVIEIHAQLGQQRLAAGQRVGRVARQMGLVARSDIQHA